MGIKKLKKLNDQGEREGYVTIFRDAFSGCELIVGGRTKKACAEAYKRLWLTDGTGIPPIDPDYKLIYRTAFRKVLS
jgi:hypothetical protein